MSVYSETQRVGLEIQHFLELSIVTYRFCHQNYQQLFFPLAVLCSCWRLLSRISIPQAGVAQGSILYPTLFLIFWCDIPLPQQSVTRWFQFVDDTALWVSSVFSTVRSRIFFRLEACFRQWEIKPNPNKMQTIQSKHKQFHCILGLDAANIILHIGALPSKCPLGLTIWGSHHVHVHHKKVGRQKARWHLTLIHQRGAAASFSKLCAPWFTHIKLSYVLLANIDIT